MRIYLSSLLIVAMSVLSVHAQDGNIEIKRKTTEIERNRHTHGEVRQRKVYLDTDVPTKNPYQKVQTEDQKKVLLYEKALASRIDVDFKDMTIRDAVKKLGTQLKVDFLTAWPAWERRLSIDPEKKINVTLKRIPAERIIRLMLTQATDEPMVLEVQPWFIEIKPERWAKNKTVAKSYFLYDIKFAPEDYSKKPLIVTESNISSQGQTVRRDREYGIRYDSKEGFKLGRDVDLKLNDRKVTSRSNTSGFVVRQDIDYRSPGERAASMAEVIRKTIAPKSWRKNGGDKNSISTFEDKIVINAPLYIHREIANPIAIFRKKNQ